MSISKNVTFPNGVVGLHHTVDRISFNKTGAGVLCSVQIASWSTYQDFLEGKAPVHRHPVPNIPAAVTEDLFPKIEQIMVTWEGSLLYGGSLTADDLVGELERAQATKWRELLLERDRREFLTFTWNGMVFDCDPESRARLAGSVQLATLAVMQGTPEAYSDEWTLADNSKYPVGVNEIFAIGVALGEHVKQLHATGRQLREMVFSPDATVESVKSIQWPAAT